MIGLWRLTMWGRMPWVVVLLVFIVIDGRGQTAVKKRLVVGARIPLTQAANGVKGELQILKDARITAAITKQEWKTGEFVGEGEYGFAGFKEVPARNALIRVVDRNGRVVDSEDLERPLARVGAVHLYPNAMATYLLTVDYSAGFGSYSGPITYLVEVAGGHLHWVESADAQGKHAKISVMNSLKTAWKIVGAGSGGKEILQAACRPTNATMKTGDDFTTTYSRYFFDGVQWRVVSRTLPGFTEFEDGFPSRLHFP